MNAVKLFAISSLYFIISGCGPSALDQALNLLKQIDAEVVSSTDTLKNAESAEQAATSLTDLKKNMMQIGAQLKSLEEQYTELSEQHAKSYLLVQRHQIVLNLAELNKAAEAARLKYRSNPKFENAVRQFSQGMN
jgi:hypothetical protein